jgi:hypothetical protein
MNLNTNTLPAAIGAAFAGGFFSGLINVGADTYALIVAPKAAGERTGAWSGSKEPVPNAYSYCDGLANTSAMAEAGGDLAKWARELRIDGFDDWYVPSRDELELVYRNLKSTSCENCESFRDGDNPSSAPVGYPYTSTTPGQTPVAAFQEGGAEALEPAWYWSSTQYAASPSDAWVQIFGNGIQGNGRKSYEGRARAVRRLKI